MEQLPPARARHRNGKAPKRRLGLGLHRPIPNALPLRAEVHRPRHQTVPGKCTAQTARHKLTEQAWWIDDSGTVAPDNVPIRETWEAMESLVDDGIACSIGVSNFQAQSLYDIKTYARHPLSALQIEHHPYLAQPELVQMAQENGIAVTAYSSFGPQSFVELPPAFSKRARGIPLLFDAEPVRAVAGKYGVSPARVLLRWATQRLVLWGSDHFVLRLTVFRNIAVIPKSNNQTRLAENLDILGFDLTTEEIEAITALDRGLRFNDPGFYLPDYPLRIFA
jgi:D-xylose reductase